MANRVTMSICGTEYILVAEEDAAYMERSATWWMRRCRS